MGIHLTDLFLWLFGNWAEIRAIVGTLDHPIDVEDVAMALVRFESGALGTITSSTVSPRQETYLRLDFQRATVDMSALYSYTNTNWKFNLFDDSPTSQPSTDGAPSSRMSHPRTARSLPSLSKAWTQTSVRTSAARKPAASSNFLHPCTSPPSQAKLSRAAPSRRTIPSITA